MIILGLMAALSYTLICIYILRLFRGVKLDPRIEQYTKVWGAWEIYRGQKVVIPDSWVDRYFEYLPLDKPNDAEKQAYVNLGWKDYDEEVHIAIGLFGPDALKPVGGTVMAEIARMGGAEIHVTYNGKEIVKFPAYRKKLEYGYYVTPAQNL